MNIHCLPMGAFQTNCYIVRTVPDDECWVFDPGLDPRELLQYLAQQRVRVSRILLTHGHADHIAGVEVLKRANPQAVLIAPAGDEAMLSDPALNLSAIFGFPLTAPPADQLVRTGDVLSFGAAQWRVLDTSGHTPGGVSYYCPQSRVAIVGDALFAGSVGRCDLPGADYDRLIDNIRRNLLSLPGETRILPGHGPATDVATELTTNPFLVQPRSPYEPQSSGE